MNYKIVTVSWLVITLSWSVPIQAAPTIDTKLAQLNDGYPVTVSGMNFGDHSPRVIWLGGKNGLIENTGKGSTPSADNWLFGTQWAISTVDDSQHHSYGKSIRVDMGGSLWNGDIRYNYGNPIGYDTDIFISWWVRRVHSGSGQWKMFRLCYTNSIVDPDVPQLTMFNHDPDNQFVIRPGPTTSDGQIVNWKMPYPEEDNRWYRVDVRIHTGSGHNTGDGLYEVTLFDPSSNTPPRSVSQTWTSFNSSGGQHDYYQWFLWQNYIGNGITSSTVWMDDLYIQVGTQARVELGNAPTWSACTVREIQPVVSWHDRSITIDANRGSFGIGETVYLYVVDGNGVVSKGQPVTLVDKKPPPGIYPLLAPDDVKADIRR